jgi:hypothetical protein
MKANEAFDDPIQLAMKKTCRRDLEGQPPPFKHLGFPSKEHDLELTSVDSDGCLVIENLQMPMRLRKHKDRLSFLIFVYSSYF